MQFTFDGAADVSNAEKAPKDVIEPNSLEARHNQAKLTRTFHPSIEQLRVLKYMP